RIPRRPDEIRARSRTRGLPLGRITLGSRAIRLSAFAVQSPAREVTMDVVEAPEVRRMALAALSRGWLDGPALWDAAGRSALARGKAPPEEILGRYLTPKQLRDLADAPEPVLEGDTITEVVEPLFPAPDRPVSEVPTSLAPTSDA